MRARVLLPLVLIAFGCAEGVPFDGDATLPAVSRDAAPDLGALVVEDASFDAETDVTVDAALDTGPDAELDGDIDAEADAEMDAEVDAEADAKMDAEVDAEADEGLPCESMEDYDTICSAGEGGCAVEGAWICSEDGHALACDAVALVATDETCDGTDEDCDGIIDEAIDGSPLTEGCYTGPADTLGVGACAPGLRICEDGGFGLCVGAHLPADREICNRVDDDCDGAVDEGLDGEVLRQGGCYTGPAGTEGVGLCKAGIQICADGEYGICLTQQLPVAEVCGNDQDDDCDGSTDEGCPAQ